MKIRLAGGIALLAVLAACWDFGRDYDTCRGQGRCGADAGVQSDGGDDGGQDGGPDGGPDGGDAGPGGPVLDQVKPSYVSTDGGDLIHVLGSNFDPTSVVTVHGFLVPTTFVSASDLTFVSPPRGNCGVDDVVVSTPGAGVSSPAPLHSRCQTVSFTPTSSAFLCPNVEALGAMPLGPTGKVDLVAGCPAGPQVLRYAGGSPVPVQQPDGGNVQSIAFGDVDRDGKPDFVTSQYGSGQAFAVVYRNDGGYQFDIAAVLPLDTSSGYGGFAAAMADLNADGLEDVVVSGHQGHVAVYYGMDGGGFPSRSVPSSVGDTVTAIQIGDLDLDSERLPEIVATDDCLFQPFYNTGTSYPSASSPIQVGPQPSDLKLANFGSGRLDAVVVNAGASNVNCPSAVDPPLSISVLQNTGPILMRKQWLDAGTAPWKVAVGDFNLDGRMDAVVTDRGDPPMGISPQALVYLGLGNTLLAPPLSFGPGPTVGSLRPIAAGDFNGDGLLDFACGAGGAVLTFTNTSQ